MNEEKWDIYFKTITNREYILRFGILYLTSLFVVTIFGYFIFDVFNFKNPLCLSVLFFIVGLLRIILKLSTHKQELIEKLNKLK